jgi:hypothetical protein
MCAAPDCFGVIEGISVANHTRGEFRTSQPRDHKS